MPLAHVSLGQPQYVPLNVTALLINQLGFKTFLKEIILHNISTTIESVEIFEADSVGGTLGTPGIERRLLKVTVNPDDTIFIGFADVIILDAENDAIFCKCSTASKVVIKFEGDLEDV